MNTNKIIYVYDAFTEEALCYTRNKTRNDIHTDAAAKSPTDVPRLMGRLYVDVEKGRESYSFEYDASWLEAQYITFPFDPDIQLRLGRQYPTNGKIFGTFADASPDRWGRILMKKRERIIADKENRKPRALYDSDFLLGVYDKARMGGLRLKLAKDGDYLSSDDENPIPAWTSLRTLEEASRKFEDNDVIVDEPYLEQLIRPGSSLGGARPKATVVDPEGNLWIAKFPSKNDESDVGAWEKVATDLARLCGLDVPETKLEVFSRYGSTFLTKRFDRSGRQRVHFASAMALLGKTDGASAFDGSSYLDIASFIKANGANPGPDLKELWKRIVLSMAISNTDDHLRNHAFLLRPSGWKLSPLYDVNPVPYGDELSLNVGEDDNRISFSLAIEVSPCFGISRTEATSEVARIREIVKGNWERLAESCRLSKKSIEYMRPAFSECYR